MATKKKEINLPKPTLLGFLIAVVVSGILAGFMMYYHYNDSKEKSSAEWIHDYNNLFVSDTDDKDQYEAIWTIKYNSVDLLTLAKLDSAIRVDHKSACNIDLNLKELKKDDENLIDISWYLTPTQSSSYKDSIAVKVFLFNDVEDTILDPN